MLGYPLRQSQYFFAVGSSMSALLLNEQFWLTLLYLVVLPMLVVGVAVASFRGRQRGRVRNRVGGEPVVHPTSSFPVDPTPMEFAPPPRQDRTVLGGERIVAIGGGVPAPQPMLGGSDLEARLDTLRAELGGARRTLQHQDIELSSLRSDLEDVRGELADRETIIAALRDDLRQRRAGADQVPGLQQEIEQLQAQLGNLLAERAFRRSETDSIRPAALIEEEPIDEDDVDDDEIVVPMPASAADEFEVDEALTEEEPATGAHGRQLRLTRDRLGQASLSSVVLDQQSMAFDGSQTPVVVESGYAGLSEGSWTIETWVKPARSRIGRALLSYSVAGSTRVAVTAGGPRPALGVEVDGQSLPSVVEPRLIADTWQHIAVAWDSQGGRLTLYLDGGLAYSGEIAPGARIPRGGRLLLGQEVARGQHVYLPARSFEGALAEVRVWSHVRNPSAVRRDTHRQAAYEAGVSFWRVG